jgi:hypothetical protein
VYLDVEMLEMGSIVVLCASSDCGGTLAVAVDGCWCRRVEAQWSEDLSTEDGLQVCVRAMYLALVDESETTFWNEEFHEMGPPASWNRYALIDLWVATSLV